MRTFISHNSLTERMFKKSDTATTSRPQETLNGALEALCVLGRLHQVAADPAGLRHTLALGHADAVSRRDLLRAAAVLGLHARMLRPAAQRLPQMPLPALALMLDGSVLLLAQCDGRRVLSQAFDSQVAGQPAIEPLDVFLKRWSGELMLATSQASLVGGRAAFDLSWFIPAVVKYRRLLAEVLLVSIFLQLLGLASPLFLQVVMDKVLVHHGTTTLDVMVIALVAVMLFESALTVLRSYVFSHTTSRIDAELGARLYRHLLHLPMAYFEARRVGDSVARVRQLEDIRSFITGGALTLVLDAVFSVVFVGLMLLYSRTLTFIVLASLPLYVLLSLAVVPVLRRRLDEKFAYGAAIQAQLVESVSGIQTLKAAALEPSFVRRWEQQFAAYVQASLRTQNLASAANEAVGLVGKLVSATVLWFGAHAVMEQQLTVGMFVAFTMFSNRLASPIMRMAQLWTDFQQTGVAVRRVADILNTPTEPVPTDAAPLPALQGRVSLQSVCFRYRPESRLALTDVSLDIPAGEVLGIVGRSGCGKSTLAKLLQRLYAPEQGRVLVDSIDISLVDAAHLRRQLGVVLQDNLLFSCSLRQNIAIADPGAPLQAVMHAAQLAGAHDFIAELPQGYDTPLGEQGSGLSGGQRQRIAIARALFTNPRVLIFDEATSALDYESEAALQANMAEICRGRTVLIIAHRLSSVRHAHRIIAMDQGRIVEAGSHAALLAQRGLYHHLWSLQQGREPVAPLQEEAAV